MNLLNYRFKRQWLSSIQVNGILAIMKNRIKTLFSKKPGQFNKEW